MSLLCVAGLQDENPEWLRGHGGFGRSTAVAPVEEAVGPEAHPPLLELAPSAAAAHLSVGDPRDGGLAWGQFNRH